MKLHFYLIGLVFVCGSKLSAQQNSLFNTYIADPLLLNIAYSEDKSGNANLHYRTQWIGLNETPKVIQLNAYQSFGKSSAVALRVHSQTQGLLDLTSVTLGYGYRMKLSETSNLNFGLGLGFSQAVLASSRAVVIDIGDAALNEGNKQVAKGFDTEFGAMYIDPKLKAGISVLHLYNTNPDFSGSSAYSTLPQLNTQVSYIIKVNGKIDFEPCVLARNTIGGNNVYEGVLNFTMMKTFSAGLGYRTNYGMLVLLGFKKDKFKLLYSFDYGLTDNASSLGSSHQIMLGFNYYKGGRVKKMAQTTF